MKKSTLKALIAAPLLALTAVTAQATTVLDFEDITGFSGRANFETLGITNTYQGYDWPTSSSSWPSSGSDSPWAVVDNSDSQFSSVGAYSGTQALWNWNDGPQREINFGEATDVQGAYFNVFQAGQDWGAQTVQFRAFDALNQLIGTSALLYLDRDSSNPAWQWLDASFSGVYRLEILSTNDRFSGHGWWTMDDLTLGPVTPASAPATLALMGLGLAGIAFRNKKQKKA